LYYNKAQQFIIPVFNVVIKVDKGNITDVVWDNDCYACLTSDQCFTNNDVTYLNDTSIKAVDKNCKSPACVNDKDNAFNCDPKFYITWFGTDSNQKQMKSSNLAMSRFRQYAVGSLYNSAKDTFNKTMDTLKNTWDNVKQKTDKVLKGDFS
jgi:hypothetical protein